jgi:O-antigen/teichoic acid export membrane protein
VSDNMRGHRDVRLVDTTGMYRAQVLRQFPFPEDLGRFVPEALVWNRIAWRYRTLFVSDVVSVVRYQPDGLTARSRAVRVGESLAYREYYRELLSFPHALPPWKRFRANVGYVRCCLHLGTPLVAPARQASSRLWWLVALFPGVLAWARDRWAVRQEAAAGDHDTTGQAATRTSQPRTRGWVGLASGGQVAALAIGAATNLFYARLLAPDQLGQLALVLTIAGLAMVLTELGLHNWLTRAVAAGEVVLADAAALVVKLTPALAALAGGLGTVLLSRVTGLGEALGLTASQSLLIPELAIALAFYQAALTLTQGTGRFRERACVPLVNAVLTLALTAGALLTWATVDAAVHATATAYVLAGAWFITRTVRGVPIAPIDRQLARRAVREARPLWFNTLLSFGTSAGDVLIARSVLSLGDVGYYHIVKKLALAGLAPLTALLPMLFSRLSAAERDAERVQLHRSYQGWLTASFAAGMVLAAPWIVPVMSLLFGERYAARHAALLVLAGALWLQATHDLLGYLLASAKAFAAPLVANAVVVAVAVSLAVALEQLALAQFAFLLAVAHMVGVVVMTAAARRRGLEASAPFLLVTVVVAAGALALAAVLVSAPLALSVPASVVGALVSVLGLLSADPLARGRVRSSLRRRWSIGVP